MASGDGSGRHMVELDWLRFGAALTLCIYHLGYAVWADPRSGLHAFAGADYRFPELQPLWFGWVGVQVFFVISGLVIAASAERARPVDFFISRARRLYPAVWICASISMALAVAYQLHPASVLWDRYANSMLLLPSYPYIEGVYWTLQVEISFYGVVALFCALVGREHLMRLAQVLALASFAYLALEWAEGFSIHNRLENALLLRHGGLFAVGMYVYALGKGRLTARQAPFVVVSMAAAVLSIRDHAAGILQAFPIDPGTMSPAGVAAPYVVWSVALAVCIAAVLKPMKVSGRAMRIARLLGLASYPLYLVHYTLGVAITKALGEAWQWQTASLVAATLAVCMVAMTIAMFAEPWLRRQTFDRLLTYRRQAASIAEPS